MQIKHRYFPHPVLCSFFNGYGEHTYEVELKSEAEGDFYRFEAIFKTTSQTLKRMIQQNQACYLLHFECGPTRYRKVFTSNDETLTFIISAYQLENQVDVCPAISAIKDIDKFASDEFDEAYGEEPFSINRGDILAVAEPKSLIIVKKKDSLRPVSSVFMFERSPDSSNPIDFNLDGDKVIIYLPEKEFNNLSLLNSNNKVFAPLYSLMTVVPVLANIIEFIKSSKDSEIEPLQNKKWYAVIMNAIKKKNINMNDTSISIAHELLGKPLGPSLELLMEMEGN
ncbi:MULTISPECIES: hypothetical protein [Paenibacillus]|uniref:hypothetical protein n=1 Tax=Paenibacillus TaxID=44249 RepID=UPI0002FB6648|nr:MULTISPECIES: hypothetical protein [Paenibacillus]KKD55227.1 hypothetical protein C400_05165 [Paenibacillus sp. ICGEB2008]MBE3650197.1 hypothetical protein [Paenibacillus polymyxa]PNQ84890.1 hypothetical protein C1T20_17555 [Paenibacillus polymyxa]UMR36664.1 hypothetical protein MJ749_04335 [Paenibacillus polymyxa]UNL95498.1 hypothetical protein CPY53_19065 [Paenibacillus polymyxa]